MNRNEVEQVIQDFFDADYAGDADRMAISFHDDAEFFEYNAKRDALRKMSGAAFVDGFRNKPDDAPPPDYPRFNEILSIDFTGENTAVARTRMRVRNMMFTDILCLMRINGVWGIIVKIASGVPVE